MSRCARITNHSVKGKTPTKRCEIGKQVRRKKSSSKFKVARIVENVKKDKKSAQTIFTRKNEDTHGLKSRNFPKNLNDLKSILLLSLHYSIEFCL